MSLLHIIDDALQLNPENAPTLIWSVAMNPSGVFGSFSNLIIYLPPSLSSSVSLNHLIWGPGLASRIHVITRRFACCFIVGFWRKWGALPDGTLQKLHRKIRPKEQCFTQIKRNSVVSCYIMYFDVMSPLWLRSFFSMEFYKGIIGK